MIWQFDDPHPFKLISSLLTHAVIRAAHVPCFRCADVHFDGLKDDDNRWLPIERMRLPTPPVTTPGPSGATQTPRSKRNVTPMTEPDPLLSPRAKLAGSGHCVALF